MLLESVEKLKLGSLIFLTKSLKTIFGSALITVKIIVAVDEL